MCLQIIWDVSPEIFEGIYIRWYGLLFALGYFVAYYILMFLLKKEKVAPKILDHMISYALIGGIVGARLGHCLFYEPHIYLAHPIEILYIWKGGLASHGGALGVLLSFMLLSKKHNISFVWILSRAIIVVPITGAFIRFGNLMNSEIFGIPTQLPWGFVFKNSFLAHNGTEELIPRHPTQLYESLCYLITSVIIILYYRKKVATKNINNFIPIGIFMIGVFLSRFLVEFLKVEQVRFEEGLVLNMGQLLSIPFILFGIYCFSRKGDFTFSPQLVHKEKQIDSSQPENQD